MNGKNLPTVPRSVTNWMLGSMGISVKGCHLSRPVPFGCVMGYQYGCGLVAQADEVDSGN